MQIRLRVLKPLETVLLWCGLALLGFCAFTYVASRVYSHMTVTGFHPGSASQASHAGMQDGVLGKSVDYTLWSEKRIRAYEATLAGYLEKPLGVLRVEKIGLEVPIFEGTDDVTLNRGVGRIIGTAHPGQAGNMGIAGHRDGFFRGLKDVNVGDTIHLETATGTQTFVIDGIKIVAPNDVSVLRSGETPSLTLVTCYPFYFIGSAPQRYIVHASLTSDPKSMNEPVKASLKATDSRTKENTQ